MGGFPGSHSLAWRRTEPKAQQRSPKGTSGPGIRALDSGAGLKSCELCTCSDDLIRYPGTGCKISGLLPNWVSSPRSTQPPLSLPQPQAEEKSPLGMSWEPWDSLLLLLSPPSCFPRLPPRGGEGPRGQTEAEGETGGRPPSAAGSHRGLESKEPRTGDSGGSHGLEAVGHMTMASPSHQPLLPSTQAPAWAEELPGAAAGAGTGLQDGEGASDCPQPSCRYLLRPSRPHLCPPSRTQPWVVLG